MIFGTIWVVSASLVVFFLAAMALPVIIFHVLRIGTIKRGTSPSHAYLTFDDGPDPRFTPAFLDLLSTYQAKATFFCLGEKVLRHPELAKRIHEEGHEIGVHGFDHRHPWADPPWRAAKNIRSAVSLITEITGKKPRLYRPPWGYWSLWNWLSTRDLHRVLWSLPGKDWVQGATAQSVFEHIAGRLRPGDVILLHDGGEYSGITLEMLPKLLALIRSRELKAVTIGEILAQ